MPPPVWVAGGEGTSRGWIRCEGGSWNARRLALEFVDAIRKWSQM